MKKKLLKIIVVSLLIATMTASTFSGMSTKDPGFWQQVADDYGLPFYNIHTGETTYPSWWVDGHPPGESAPAAPSAPATPSTPKCEHDYAEEVTTEPTCVEEGVKTFTCTKCGKTYTDTMEPTGEHEYDMDITTEPTCTEDGVKTFTCVFCGDSYIEEVSATGHEYDGKVTTEPTCTEDGAKTFTCVKCGDSYEEVINALGHDAGEWQISVEPKWFTGGEEALCCGRYGELLDTREVPSIYPVWYLYIGIGLSIAIVVTVFFTVSKKKKKEEK